MRREVAITRVSDVEARYIARRPWPWAEDNRAAIAANWERRLAATPKMFNGRVLLLSEVNLTPGSCRSAYFETDYADFVAWIDLGHPDPGIANGFAMGALLGSDGAYICGVMADHTANAGRVYFPAGTPDPSDLRPDGTVDLAGSLTRELVEETGLRESDWRLADDWIVVQHWPTVGMMRNVTLNVPAEEAVELIGSLIARQGEPELKGFRIVRGPEDIDPRTMPLFLQSFFRWSFDQR